MAELDKNVVNTLNDFMQHTKPMNTPQERFDCNYVTAQEIMERMNVTRPTVLAKMNGRFPVIKVGNTYIWERTSETDNFLQAWEIMRNKGE